MDNMFVLDSRHIICFQHCDNKFIYCFDVPEICPSCKCVINCKCLLKEPVSLAYPFVQAKETPCAVLLKPTRGVFLDTYNLNDDLHIGITTSSGFVAHYNCNGVHYEPSDAWSQALIINQLNDNAWYEHWDTVLLNLIGSAEFTVRTYNEYGNNCYTFVLTFIRKLNILSHIKEFATTKEVFCEKMIIPPLQTACRYTFLYRHIAKNGYYSE